MYHIIEEMKALYNDLPDSKLEKWNKTGMKASSDKVLGLALASIKHHVCIKYISHNIIEEMNDLSDSIS